MSDITIKSPFGSGLIPVSSEFITNFMPYADGEYVKIYLYILKCACTKNAFSVSGAADALEKTENDIVRALSYWERVGLIGIERESSTGTINSLSLLSTDTQKNNESHFTKESKSPAKIDTPQKPDTFSSSYIEDDDFKELIFAAEQYFNNTLSKTDTDILLNLYDNLHLPASLIDYLLCHAVERGHASVRYVEKIALELHEDGVLTLKDAKEYFSRHRDVVKAVTSSFGLHRGLGQIEHEYVTKWSDTLGFDTDLITAACDLTLIKAQGVSFPYADKILTDWHQKGVTDREDIKKLDDEFRTNAKNSSSSAGAKKTQQPVGTTKFHNFNQRSDIDFEKIERKIAADIKGDLKNK